MEQPGSVMVFLAHLPCQLRVPLESTQPIQSTGPRTLPRLGDIGSSPPGVSSGHELGSTLPGCLPPALAKDPHAERPPLGEAGSLAVGQALAQDTTILCRNWARCLCLRTLGISGG